MNLIIIINLFFFLFFTNITKTEITAEWREAIEKNSPLIWLDSEENHFPGKIEDFLPHVKPIVGGTSKQIALGAPDELTIYNLNFSTTDPRNVYLTSNDDPAANPQASWMLGVKPSKNNVSPLYAIFVDKGVDNEGKVQADVFYFMWYPFNLGSKVAVIDDTFGNHVGDWEYIAIRFVNYNPTQVFTSQHSNGKLYSPDLIKKTNEGHFIIYSARGNHANYITAEVHCHIKILACVVEDFTSQGTIWNTWENLQIFEYINGSFNSGQNPDPSAWLNFQGFWGDQTLPDNDPRQKIILTFKKWTEGPTSPIVKKLYRKNLCQDQNDCKLITS